MIAPAVVCTFGLSDAVCLSSQTSTRLLGARIKKQRWNSSGLSELSQEFLLGTPSGSTFMMDCWESPSCTYSLRLVKGVLSNFCFVFLIFATVGGGVHTRMGLQYTVSTRPQCNVVIQNAHSLTLLEKRN